ncbi:MAG: hypothetical protein ACRCXZ_05510 [Patescibacteria group bacterium]
MVIAKLKKNTIMYSSQKPQPEKSIVFGNYQLILGGRVDYYVELYLDGNCCIQTGLGYEDKLHVQKMIQKNTEANWILFFVMEAVYFCGVNLPAYNEGNIRSKAALKVLKLLNPNYIP